MVFMAIHFGGVLGRSRRDFSQAIKGYMKKPPFLALSGLELQKHDVVLDEYGQVYRDLVTSNQVVYQQIFQEDVSPVVTELRRRRRLRSGGGIRSDGPSTEDAQVDTRSAIAVFQRVPPLPWTRSAIPLPLTLEGMLERKRFWQQMNVKKEVYEGLKLQPCTLRARAAYAFSAHAVSALHDGKRGIEMAFDQSCKAAVKLLSPEHVFSWLQVLPRHMVAQAGTGAGAGGDGGDGDEPTCTPAEAPEGAPRRERKEQLLQGTCRVMCQAADCVT